MKNIWEFWIQGNMVDILLWGAALFMGIKYGASQWRKRSEREVAGWLFVLFLCFYGGFLIYRLGTMNFLIVTLIDLCVQNGIDLSDILPAGSY